MKINTINTAKCFDLMYAYAINDITKIKKMSNDARQLVRYIMCNKAHNVDLREQIVARVSGHTHIPQKHSTVSGIYLADAINSAGKPIEIKTEQHDDINNRISQIKAQIVGTGIFKLTPDLLDPLFNIKKPIINHGFFINGQLLAVYEFPITLPEVVNRLTKYTHSGKKTAPRYSAVDWITNQKTKCVWINPQLIVDYAGIKNGPLKGCIKHRLVIDANVILRIEHKKSEFDQLLLYTAD